MKFLIKLSLVMLIAYTVVITYSDTITGWFQALSGHVLVSEAAEMLDSTVNRLSAYAAPGTAAASSTELTQAIADSMLNCESEITFSLAIPDRAGEEAYILEQVQGALNAIRREYPEIFWMTLDGYEVQWYGVPGGDRQVTLQVNYSYTASQVQETQARIRKVTERIAAGAPEDTYEAAKYYHDWIVDNTAYSMEATDGSTSLEYAYVFGIDGVFLQGSAVCEGYAKAYKQLCDQAGIPCKIILGTHQGEGHAWNCVQLDGSWYLVDCTSDDPVGTGDVLRWDYFLRGTKAVVDEEYISDIYQDDGANYPTLSAVDYSA